MVPAQATGAAFQTLAGARLLFEGDADYQLSDEIIREMQSLFPAADTNGYSASFVYRVYGHPLRGALYPPRVVLHKKGFATYKNRRIHTAPCGFRSHSSCHSGCDQ
jgi:hypothetical protein